MPRKNKQHGASPAPLTKVDVEQFIQGIVAQIEELYASNERWKDEIVGKIEASERNVKHYFDVVAENIHRDAINANKDRIEDHERRITDLEAVVQK